MAKLAYQKRLYQAKVDESRTAYPAPAEPKPEEKIEHFDDEYYKDSAELPMQHEHHKTTTIIKAKLPDGSNVESVQAAQASLEPGEIRVSR